MSLPFSLIVPGQAPVTNFQQDNQIYHIDMPNPINIPHVCFTLTQPLQNDQLTAAFYYTLPPYSQFHFLGAVSNNKPSGIFETGFNLKPQLVNMPTVKFCIRAQTYQQICQLQVASDGKKEYTKLVAQNLYNYMMSYHKSELLIGGAGDYIVIPSNFLDRWLNKFQAKYKLDPNFILKTTEA